MRVDGDGVMGVEELSSRWVMLVPFGTRLGSGAIFLGDDGFRWGGRGSATSLGRVRRV